MDYAVICAAALLASALTLFSGFGLGTLLMPVFAIFFPVDVAVALTAVVHFLNNLFKLVLLGRHSDKSVVLRFGLPAVAAALLGALALRWLSGLPPIAHWGSHEIHPVKLVVAILMAIFAVLEIVPTPPIDRKWLPVGGLLSGFLGGLSGHQGALRSAFLVKAGLTKEAFVASGVVIACLVDVTRLAVYAENYSAAGLQQNGPLLAAAAGAAFLGAWVGSRLVRKVTVKALQIVVSVMLFVIAFGLGAGII